MVELGSNTVDNDKAGGKLSKNPSFPSAGVVTEAMAGVEVEAGKVMRGVAVG